MAFMRLANDSAANVADSEINCTLWNNPNLDGCVCVLCEPKKKNKKTLAHPTQPNENQSTSENCMYIKRQLRFCYSLCPCVLSANRKDIVQAL